MSHNHVLVHSCLSPKPRDAVALGSGRERIFYAAGMINVTCSCTRRIDFKTRDTLLERGEVLVLTNKNCNGGIVPDWRAVIRMWIPRDDYFRTTPLRTVPSAHCIDAYDIERMVGISAFGSDGAQSHAVNFVAEYGRLEIAKWRELTVCVP